MNSLISFNNVTFAYGDHGVLDNLSFSIEEGEFVSVLGYNGSGKSTMAKLMNGILVPTSGDVFVEGFNTREESNLEQIRKIVGMVFQNPDNQIVANIVEEDIAFAPENLSLPREEIEERVTEAIAAVGLEKHRFDAPHKLSGGQKQRVAIAGVLAMRPKCIILDEPTAMLDPVGRKLVLNVIKRLNREEGITIVLITHFMEEAAESDRIIILNHGKIELDDSPKNVFAQRQKLLDIKLDVPVTTELSYQLQQQGYPVPELFVQPSDLESFILSELDQH